MASNIILTKEGDFVATWECRGIPFDVTDDAELALKKEQLNTLLRGFASEPVTIYHHNICRQVSESLTGHFDSAYLQEIDHQIMPD